jgi:hypothetical protein
VEKRKVGNPVVFCGMLFDLTNLVVCFLLKTLTMPIFSEIEEGRTENESLKMKRAISDC